MYKVTQNKTFYKFDDKYTEKIKNLQGVLKELYFYGEAYNYEAIFDKLLEKLKKYMQEETRQVEITQRETLEFIEKNYNKEFLQEIKNMFSDCVYNVHGTSNNAAKNIIKEGLKIGNSSSGELSHTTLSVGSLNIRNLYESLFNWDHHEARNMVVIDALDEHIIKDTEINMYRLPKQYIKGYIDLDNQAVVYNPDYKQTTNIKAKQEEDKHNYENDKFEPISKENIIKSLKNKDQETFVQEQFGNLMDIFNMINDAKMEKEYVDIKILDLQNNKKYYDKFYENTKTL